MGSHSNGSKRCSLWDTKCPFVYKKIRVKIALKQAKMSQTGNGGMVIHFL
jgi:hypothetical protein